MPVRCTVFDAGDVARRHQQPFVPAPFDAGPVVSDVCHGRTDLCVLEPFEERTDTMNDKMNAEIKQQWVNALRSGEYKQGRGFLQLNGEYCCLGVLCELAVKAGVVSTLEDSGKVYYVGPDGEEADAVLPYAVSDWAGLVDRAPNVSGRPPATSEEVTNDITTFNDEYEYDFSDLAVLIEEQL